jgi:hypothetical protein
VEYRRTHFVDAILISVVLRIVLCTLTCENRFLKWVRKCLDRRESTKLLGKSILLYIKLDFKS